MFNRAPINASPFNAPGNVSLTVNYTLTARGAARLYGAFALDAQGQCEFIYKRYDAVCVGRAALLSEFEAGAPGQFDLGASSFALAAVGGHMQYAAFAAAAPGRAVLYRAVVPVAAWGAYFVAGQEYAQSALGQATLGFGAYGLAAVGCSARLITYNEELRGRFRVANAALDRYELFIGIDAAPDFSAPDYTFSSLPYAVPALTVGHVYQLSVRKRNQHNLSSKNIDVFTVDLSASAEAAGTLPSAPVFSALPAAGGAIEIRAEYLYPNDGDYAADTFLVYYTTTGTNPNPATDTPIEVVMRKADGVARLDYQTSALADGTTVKVLVRVRRSPDVDSDNAGIVSAVAETSGPSAPVGHAFFGKTASQAIG